MGGVERGKASKATVKVKKEGEMVSKSKYDEIVEEKDKVIEAKDKALEEKDKVIEEKDKELEENAKVIEQLRNEMMKLKQKQIMSASPPRAYGNN